LPKLKGGNISNPGHACELLEINNEIGRLSSPYIATILASKGHSLEERERSSEF
jgi:hypothetical protein